MSFKGVTADHEILTKSGWKPLPSVLPTDEIATLCVEHNKLEYTVPTQWSNSTVGTSDNLFPILLRQNRVEVRLTPSTKILSRLTTTTPWEFTTVSELNGIDFFVRNYTGESLLRPINYQPSTTVFSGRLFLPLNENNTFLVRKNGRLTWVCTN
jgi:hypothetical protein